MECALSNNTLEGLHYLDQAVEVRSDIEKWLARNVSLKYESQRDMDMYYYFFGTSQSFVINLFMPCAASIIYGYVNFWDVDFNEVYDGAINEAIDLIIKYGKKQHS